MTKLWLVVGAVLCMAISAQAIPKKSSKDGQKVWKEIGPVVVAQKPPVVVVVTQKPKEESSPKSTFMSVTGSSRPIIKVYVEPALLIEKIAAPSLWDSLDGQMTKPKPGTKMLMDSFYFRVVKTGKESSLGLLYEMIYSGVPAGADRREIFSGFLAWKLWF